jgi:hypothetical protein
VDQHIRAFIGIDTSKLRNAVAVAEEGTSLVHSPEGHGKRRGHPKGRSAAEQPACGLDRTSRAIRPRFKDHNRASAW